MTCKSDTRFNTRFFGHAPGIHHEANLSAIEDAPQAHARLSRAHENQSRTRGDQRAQSEGQGPARRLSEGGAPRNPNSRHARGREDAAGATRAARTLRSRTDFEAVLSSGRRFASRNFVLRALVNGGAHARLGIIAGKKVAVRAVDRNRARRLIREAFRSMLAQLGPYDVTVQLRGNLRAEPNAHVREELEKLLQSVARLSASG